ncbi:serine hydrolase [uncultured Brevundimonas sp.]|uniref:serine hydrolase domain-containing protein n=1 Tax=uncultured Brevundimonas sp. TaxID=213418 RepID=UPI002625F4BB|nr:serine hydrolase domain-containing protein [uncultured Brevundimonas sp.]
MHRFIEPASRAWVPRRPLGLLVATVLLFLSNAAAAQTPARDAAIAEAADTAIEGFVGSPDGPGAAILIARGDQVFYRAARGRAELELGVELSPDQVFSIASITKTFTAALVLRLAQDGRLSLDDSLSTFLPTFPGAEQITVRQLLSHTAGLSDKTAPADIQPGFSRRDLSTAALVAEIAKRPLAFAPGRRQAYSNAGYILLGAVIEAVTGLPWHVAMHDQLLEPLGLSQTRYGLAATIIPGRVRGYVRTDRESRVENAGFISMTVPSAAGALVSTVDDLHRFMRALAQGSALGHEGFRQMTTPTEVPEGPTDSYGLGMYVWTVRGQNLVGHTGQINGFASALIYLPSQDVTIVALANDEGLDAQTLGRRLAAIVLGDPYDVVAPQPLSEAEMLALVGTYQHDQEVRTLLVRDGILFARRDQGTDIPLQMSANGRLHFVPDDLSYLVPIRDEAGATTRLEYLRRGELPAIRYDRVLKP